MTEAGKPDHSTLRSNHALNKVKRFLYALVAGVFGILLFQWTGISNKAGMALYDREMRLLVAAEGKKEDNTSSQTLRKNSGSSDSASLSPSRKKAPIALVMIDQSSLDWVQNELGLGWPWPRELYGLIAYSLRNADVQAYDILFTEPSTYGPEDDSRCAEAMRSAGNVVLATLTDRKPVLAVSNALYGHVVARVDSDGICRQYQAALDTDAGKIPSLGLAAISALNRKNSIADEKSISLSEAFEPLEPLAPFEAFEQTVFLKFEDSSRFERYSAAQVLAGSPGTGGSDFAGLNQELNFEGKIVLIGITAPGLMDRQATPINPAQPGVEIHATFISNALSSSFIELSPIGVEVCITILALVLAALLPTMRTRIWTIVGFVAAIIVPIGLSFAFFRNLVFYNAVPAIAAGLFAFIAAIVLGYQAEGRQRAYLRRAFAQYLSPEVISELIEQPKVLRLGGESKVITTLFSDLAGFTAISEKLDPERLTQFMNEYLGIISEEILAQGGTLDKYVGDAVVAFWNAPLDIEDHALRACMAACHIQEKLREIGPELEKRFGISPRTRIGIATGSAVVGNLGSTHRFAYTAVGDSVNIASRLENLNKVLGTAILTIRETVAAACAGSSRASSPSSLVPAAQDLDSELAPEIRLPQLEGKTLLFRRLGPAIVEGKLQAIELWELRATEKDNCAQGSLIEPWQEARHFSK